MLKRIAFRIPVKTDHVNSRVKVSNVQVEKPRVSRGSIVVDPIVGR